MPSRPDLAVVAPFFNEEESLPSCVKALHSVVSDMNISYEIVLVDDGSQDNWREALPSSPQLANCRVVELVGNSGHQAALEAGIRETEADFVITLDSDLQHPPELIPQMYNCAISQKCDVVYARRSSRKEEPLSKRMPSSFFYSLMRWLSGVPVQSHAADFRLMSRFAVDMISQIPGPHVFRFLLPSLNFSSQTVDYVADDRFAGSSKYGLWQMVRLATQSILQFSLRPLRIVVALGLITSLIAVVWLTYVLISWANGSTVTGWASLMGVILLLGGSILFSLGVIGEYLGRTYEALLARPAFIVKQVSKLD